MKKKPIALILAALMVILCFVFAACGGNDSGENEDNNPGASTTGDVQGENNETKEDETEEVKPIADVDYIKEKGKLVVGITIYRPMNYKDENGKLTGFDTELAEMFAKEMGVEAEFIVIDWDNKYYELKSNEIDCIWNGMTITEEGKLNASISDPYVMNAQVVVMSKDKAADYADFASMKDLKFSVESGSAGQEVLDAAKEENGKDTYNYTAVKNMSDALMEVSSGVADACVIDLTMANATVGEGTSYSSLTQLLKLSEEEYGVAFRKGSDLTAQFNNFYKKGIEDGTITKLIEKYNLDPVK